LYYIAIAGRKNSNINTATIPSKGLLVDTVCSLLFSV